MNKRLSLDMLGQYKTESLNYQSSSIVIDGSLECEFPKLETLGYYLKSKTPTDGSPCDLYETGTGKIVICGKNLCPYSGGTASGTGSWTSQMITPAVVDLPNAQQLTLSVKYEQKKTQCVLGIKIQNQNAKTITEKRIGSDVSGKYVTALSVPAGSTGIIIHLYSNYSGTAQESECEFSEVMLVRGSYNSSTMPEYEDFKEYQKYDAPYLICAPGYYDSWNMLTGQVIRRTYETIVDGENVKVGDIDTSGSIPRFIINIGLEEALINGPYKYIISTHFPNSIDEAAGNIFIKDSYPSVYLWDSTIDSVDGANEWFKAQSEAGTPVRIVYARKQYVYESVPPVNPKQVGGYCTVMTCKGGYAGLIHATYVKHV